MTTTTTTTTTKQEQQQMRFTLTDAERKAVLALKDACDQQGVEYKHTFDLAKYVLVSHSVADDSDPKAPETRLQTAMKRLKKRNQWIKKHGLDTIDAHAAMLEVASAAPGYWKDTQRYTKDKEGRVAVTSHMFFTPVDYVFESKSNAAKWRAAELYRLDLAAADLEEARKGITLVTILEGRGTMKGAFRYLKLMTKFKDTLSDMHANRVKKIYSEIPSFFVHLLDAGKLLLPTKIAKRLCIVGSIEDLHKHIDLAPVGTASEIMSLDDWATQRLEKYKETVDKLTL